MGVDWSMADEMVAAQTEIAFEQYRVALAAAGAKRGRIPAPLNIPRPYQTHKPKASSTPRVKSTVASRRANVDEALAIIAAGHRR